MVGPTGSGKTPLGQVLEREGLWGRMCLHFDFGEALRASAQSATSLLTHSDREVVERVLREGALLEDEHFPIAEKILSDYVAKQSFSGDMLIVLNGLPRHTGQAEAMKAIVEMKAVINLNCEPERTWERIRINAGGDRDGRSDDTLDKVTQRIRLFSERTAPLLRYYNGSGVPVLPLDVGTKTTAQEMRLQLEANPLL